jgi:hypothetical protein
VPPELLDRVRRRRVQVGTVRDIIQGKVPPELLGEWGPGFLTLRLRQLSDVLHPGSGAF